MRQSPMIAGLLTLGIVLVPGAARIGADHRLDLADDAVENAIGLIKASKNPLAKDPDLPFGGHDARAVAQLQRARQEIAGAKAFADNPANQKVASRSATGQGREAGRARAQPTTRLQPEGDKSPSPAGGTVAATAPQLMVLKPDLDITGVSGGPVNVGDGLGWKFQVEITNQGPVAAKTTMLCGHADPAKAAEASKNPIPVLAAHQSVKVEYTYGKPAWWFVEGGQRVKRPLYLVADCTGQLDEVSEENNQFKLWLYWDPTQTKEWEVAE